MGGLAGWGNLPRGDVQITGSTSTRQKRKLNFPIYAIRIQRGRGVSAPGNGRRGAHEVRAIHAFDLPILSLGLVLSVLWMAAAGVVAMPGR
jgi:hypothetical protein